jgi:hypothetical protein
MKAAASVLGLVIVLSRTGLEVWADQPGRAQENPEAHLP